MFCTKCGAELPAGTEYCPSCGARVGAAPATGDAAKPAAAAESAAATGAAPSEAAPVNAPATPGTVPPFAPEPAPVRKKSRRRVAIAAICIVGVLAAGGAALALTGAFGPLGQGSSSQITQIGSVEDSAEHKSKPKKAKEEPAAQEEAPEPERDQNVSSVKVDISDQATYAAANLFLSNFTEEGFGIGSSLNPLFDAADGLSAEEKQGMTIFVFNHLCENTTGRVEKGGDVGGKSYDNKIAVDSMRRETNRLFGMTLSDDEMCFESGDGLPDDLTTRATVQDGYLYFNEMHGSANLPVPAIVTAAEDLGNNTYRLTFEAYTARSYNGTMPTISDLPESVYGLPADQLKSTIGADSTPSSTGSAVVKVTAGDTAPSFTLQSISYDN